MARRVGLKLMPISRVEEVLRKARSDQADVYVPFPDITPEIRDPLATVGDRFQVRFHIGAREETVGLSPNALQQLCELAGMPVAFLERVPTSLALRLLRCCLETCDHADGRRFLLRLKTKQPARLRAILPQSHVRFDDIDVLTELRAAARDQDCAAVRVNVTDDIMFVRLTSHERINLGTNHFQDPALAGIDLITSETGAHKLEIRNCLFRIVCGNGVTSVSAQTKALRCGYTAVDRQKFRDVLRHTLDESFRLGPELAKRMAETRSAYIRDPQAELEDIFRKYKLGSLRGRLGRWILQEVLASLGIFGIQKFDLVQAFTAVARGLEHRDRIRIEDAMGSYLIDGASRN